MNKLRADKTKDKHYLTLEDWTDHEVRSPFVVSIFLPIRADFGRRFAFGFDTVESATKCFDALLIGTSKPRDYIYRLTDKSLFTTLQAL